MQPLENFHDFENFIATFTNYERQKTFRYDTKTLSLERMRGLANALGNPQKDYPSVHIAGTKGKGSTTLILEALLAAETFQVGAYTSPHVETLRERIRVSGQSIEEGEIVEGMNSILPHLPASSEARQRPFPTFFELITSLAMVHFSRKRVDWALFEVGLGGRLDSTNILAPRLSAITSVGFEHTHLLGKKLEQIATEKAGIIKDRTPVVLGDLPPEADRAVTRICHERGARIVRAPANSVRALPGGKILVPDLPDPLGAGAVRGPALRANLAIALTLFRSILSECGRPLSAERVARALAGLELPGRVELFETDSPVLLDGAHTPESFAALKQTVEELSFPRPRTAIFSLAGDKEAEPILATLEEIADDVILTRADPVRSIAPTELQERLGRGTVVESPSEALHAAFARGNPIVVCGSMYLAGELRGWLKQSSKQNSKKNPDV